MQLTRILFVLIISYSAASCVSPEAKENPNPQPATKTEYQLVWSDEFNGPGVPDSTKWSYDIGDGCPDLCGWGNNELEYYTNRPENARQEYGNLIIEARKESYRGQDYTSARLLTRGKKAWKYGRFEVRAKLPEGHGNWPAIWMLPENWEYGGWPTSGEIDIMEHVGHEPERVYATVHTDAFNHIDGTQDTDTLHVPDAESAFHEYAIEWTPDEIRWYLDDELYSRFENQHQTYKEWPFDQPFHLILNIAVGGSWGGAKGVDQTIWPQQMLVDYVRVYKKEEAAT